MNNSFKELRELGSNNKFIIELEKLKEGEKLPITSNVMFKTMITNENRLMYSAAILSQILDVSEEEILKSIKLIKNDLDKNMSFEKGRSVDFVAKLNNRIINIEMNNNDSYGTLIRNIKYITDLYQGRLHMGEAYNEEEQAIQINLNNFSYGEEDIEIEHYNIRSSERSVVLTNNIQIINIYLPKIIEKYYNNDKNLDSLNKLERLLLVMIQKDIDEAKDLSKGDYVMEKFVDDSVNATRSDIVLGEYDKELDDMRVRNAEKKEYFNNGKKEGIAEGIEKGIVEGEKTSILAMAEKMLKENIEMSLIVKVTGLSEEEIKKLI